MKTILFYWSKGADTRRQIIRLIAECERESKPCYLNIIADKLAITRAAVKPHLEILTKYGYIQALNPGGKPNYLVLTPQGIEVLKEFSSR